jgi:hypothetical protein
MSNFIESFCKVKDCYVDLYVVVHPFGDVVGCHQELAFAWSFCSEPMLIFIEDVLVV